MTLLFLDAFVGGAYGSDQFFTNPMTTFVWVDFWIGLGIIRALVGNLWDFISPLSALGRSLESLLARRRVAARPYLDEVGVWPAVGLLLAWSWLELVWERGDEPRALFVVLLAYVLAQVAGMLTFGQRFGSRAQSFSPSWRGRLPALRRSSST